jgi:tripartite-type tricarboxylate transporter receptor subunit TctC
VRSQDGIDRFHNKGDDIVGSTPEELTAKIKSEMAKYTKLIKDAGIRAE